MSACRPALAVVAVVVLAGCGGAKHPSVASVDTTTSSGTAGSGSTTSAAASPAELQQDALKYTSCMRRNGVPGFPDPQPGGGFMFGTGSGVDPSSPAFQQAQAKCLRLMPGGGPLDPGSITHPAPAWLAHMVKVSGCMRRHGVPGFPDPRTSVPSLPPGNGIVSDIQGVIFVFTGALDMQSPVFLRAAQTCGFPLHNH